MRRRSFLSVALIMIIALQIAFVGMVYPTPTVPIGATTQPAPYESNPTAETSSNVGPITGAGLARDGDFDTNTNFKTGSSTTVGYFELNTFNTSSPTFLTIGWVDFKVSYKAQATTNDKYRIVYQVGSSAWQNITAWTSGAAAQFDPSTGSQAHKVVGKAKEPNDNVWNWTDIGNVKVRVETQQVSGDDFKKLYLYEVWLSVYPAPVSLPSGVSMSVQPPTVVGMHAGDTFFVDVYATNVVKMWGYQFILDYNSSVLTAADYFSYHPFNFPGPGEVVDEAYLPVKGFDSAKTGWHLTGTPSTDDYGKYLKIEDYPLNFVNATVDGKEVGDFTFQEFDYTRYGNRVFVEVKAVGDGDDYIEIWVYNQATGTYVSAGTVTPPAGTAPDYAEMDWRRSSVDIGPILNTAAKLDSAKVYLVKRTVGTEGEIIADAMRLILPDTGYASLTYNSFLGDSVGTGSTAISLPIARVYFTVDSDGYSPLHFDLSLLVDTVGKVPHKIQDGIFTTSIIHDVAVVGVDVSPKQVLPGATVNINVTVKNQGAPYSENFTVTASFDSTVIGSLNITNLAPQNDTVLTFSWDTSGVAFNLYQIKAEASQVFGESDLTDNVFPRSDLADGKVLVGVHDIAVVNVTRYYPANGTIPTLVTLNVSQGSTVYLNVTVVNLGNFTETFNVTAQYDNFGIGQALKYNVTIETKKNIFLAVGANTTVSFAWDTSNVEFKYIAAQVQDYANWTLTMVKANVTEVPYERGSGFDYTGNNYFNFASPQEGKVNITRALPMADFEPDETTILLEGKSTIFNAAKSNTPVGTSIVRYEWSFNGTIVSFVKDVNLTISASHTFMAIGKVNVTLTIVNNLTLSDSSYKIYTVHRRDIAITNATLSSVSVLRGESVTITVSVENQGDFTEESFNVTAYFNGTEIGVPQAVQNLQNGSSSELSFTWGTVNVVSGRYVIVANLTHISLSAEFGEADKSDNSFVAGVVVVQWHNVAVTGVSVTPREVVVGDSVGVTVTVVNQGDFSESFTVALKGNGTDIGSKPVASLAAKGGSTTLIFSWNTSGQAVGVYDLKVVASAVASEFNATDNVGLGGSVTVKEAVQAPSGFGIDLYLVGGIIGAVVVVIVLFYLFRMRKPKGEVASAAGGVETKPEVKPA